MAGYQPRHDTDPVWFGDTQVNNLLIASQQTGVRITAIHGWDDRPDVRDVRELRSGQDGEYADNLYLGGRTITVEGEVYGSSWTDLQARKRALSALFTPSSTETTLKIPNPASFAGLTTYSASGMTGYERSSLRVVEAIQFGDTLDPACQVWQVILRASDPRVYSDVEVSTDSGTTGTAARTVVADQTGTYATPPTLTVTGPTAAAWEVSDTALGTRLPMSGLTLGATQTVTFDIRDRTAVFSGDYRAARMAALTPPLALWMLSETSGTTADNYEGTSARDGTYTAGYTLNQGGFLSGVGAVDLNGSTGYIQIPYDAGLFSTSLYSYAIEAWVYRDTDTGTQVVVDTISANRGVRLSIVSGTTLRMTIGNGSTTADYDFALGALCPLSTWTHLYVTSNAANHRALVNGSLIGTTSATVLYSPQTSGGFRIGATLAGGSFFNGRIAGVSWWPSGSPLLGQNLYAMRANADSLSVYGSLDASTARWDALGASSSTYTLTSTGLDNGSKLNVTYRDARL